MRIHVIAVVVGMVMLAGVLAQGATITLQQGLGGYGGCQDAHMSYDLWIDENPSMGPAFDNVNVGTDRRLLLSQVRFSST